MNYTTTLKKDNVSEISSLIERRFFFNKNVYAKQLINDNGKVIYNTIYNKIDANIIRFMINGQQSLMSYQQKEERLKWLCLDFDIKSSVIKNKDYDFILDKEYKPILLREVNKTIAKLKELDIQFSLEYSGNRGIHIWIFLDKEITKQLGDTILEELLEKVGFDYINAPDSPIALDRYPKNGNAKNNKIGLGVKVPLSYHLKSNSYSYLVNDLSEIRKIEIITDELLDEQKEKILNIKQVSVEQLLSLLNITSLNNTKQFDRKIGIMNIEHELEKIKEMLSKCEIYKYLFSKELSELNEMDRAVLTGSLIRLKSKTNSNYGKELLISYFSSNEEVYNSKITNDKLSSLKDFYPPSIAYLEEKYKIKCNYCEEKGINNVLELLDGVTITEHDNSNFVLNWIIDSEYRYLLQNDEIPLNFIKDQLKKLKDKNLDQDINNIQNGVYPEPTYYIYERLEETKTRRLYSLGAKDRVLTTYIMFEINKILYGEYTTSSSYSYRLNYDTNKKDIFVNWNSLWLQYVKDIEDKILNDAYDDYYILKLDIKSFYDHINQVFLRELMYNKPTKLIL